MRKPLVRVVFPLVVAAGAALAVSSPAHAETTQHPYRTPAQLEVICNQFDGLFHDAGNGDSWCVLPDGRQIVCFTSTNSCAYVTIVVPPRRDWRDTTWLEDVVLAEPTSPTAPPRPRVRQVVNVGTAVSR